LENVYIFYGHLEYFMGIWDILHMTIWYILYSFGTFFPGLFQEKSGNPASGPNCKKARLLGTIQQCTIVFGLHSTFVYRFYRFHRIYRLYRFIILVSVKTCIWSYVQCANTCVYLPMRDDFVVFRKIFAVKNCYLPIYVRV
jgi:hypothetical protein